MRCARQLVLALTLSGIVGCRPAEPTEARLLSAELSEAGATLYLEFDGPVEPSESTEDAFRLSRIAHSDEGGATSTWYTDISLVTCIAGRLRGLHGPCDPRAIPPTTLSLVGRDRGPSTMVALALEPPASPETLDLVCRDNGTLAAFCENNARFSNCAEFIAVHHFPGATPTFGNSLVADRSGEWVRGLQARESWFMELVTPGEGPDSTALRVTCRR